MVHHLPLIIYDAKVLSLESHIVLHKHIQVVTKSLFMVCVSVDGCMGFLETLFHGLRCIYETNPTYSVNRSQWSQLLKFHFTEAHEVIKLRVWTIKACYISGFTCLITEHRLAVKLIEKNLFSLKLAFSAHLNKFSHRIKTSPKDC